MKLFCSVNDEDLVYLDNAASSWPKPPEVAARVTEFLCGVGANPGRSAHRRSVAAGMILDEAREVVAAACGGYDPLKTVLTANVTDSLNIALFGILDPGDRCVTTGMEHNSVLRPLSELSRRGVEVSIVPADGRGLVDPDAIERELVTRTRLCVVNHASNVSGTIQDLSEIADRCQRHGTLLLVDAAQTAGCLPTDFRSMGVDLLAVTGHKGLLGPTGTGALMLSDEVSPDLVRPFRHGGTGSRSESTDHPTLLPDRLEAGTPNTAGFAGLAAGIRWLTDRGIDQVREHERKLTEAMLTGLSGIDGVTSFGPARADDRTGVVSFTIDGISPSTVGLRLDREFGVLCRVGLHCAPNAHRCLGTYPQGTVRASVGPMSTTADIDRFLEAVVVIGGGSR